MKKLDELINELELCIRIIKFLKKIIELEKIEELLKENGILND